MENRDRNTDNDPSHHLFLVEAPDRLQSAAQERADGQRAPQTSQTRPDHQAPLNHDDRPGQPAGTDADDEPEWAR
jgi:hypothetical protein